MDRPRHAPPPPPPADPALAAEIEAFQRQTARDLPSLAESAGRLRRDLERRGRSRQGTAAAAPARRPGSLRWLAAGTALGAALLILPVTSSQVAGQEVTLAIGAPLPDEARAELTRGLAAGLGSAGVRVEAEPGRTIFRLFVPAADRAAAMEAEAFAGLVRASGLPADLSVAERIDRRARPLYTIAADRVRRILVPVRGRDAAAIERDLRDRLAAIGFRETALRVQQEDGRTSVSLTATDGAGRIEQTEIRRDLHGPAAGDPPPLVLAFPDLSDLAGLPLPERRDAIERRLRAMGMKARVTIEDGQVRVEADEEIIQR